MDTPRVAPWFEIPVTDLDRASAFYEAVTGIPLRRDASGPAPTAVFRFAPTVASVSGHLVEGAPATDGAGPLVHLAVDSLEAASARCRDAGGQVVSDPVAIYPGRYVHARDPDGNPFGLFEPKPS